MYAIGTVHTKISKFEISLLISAASEALQMLPQFKISFYHMTIQKYL